MKLYKSVNQIVIEHDGELYASSAQWDKLVNRKGLYHKLLEELPHLAKTGKIDLNAPVLPPIGSQELWAAGVTYLKSKVAREKESAASGGASFYDKVYEAERPELFFKALPHRVVGHHDHVHIRRDSTWDVPEPELTLFICAEGTIEGYTVGNDMSSRSIEGENPLYLAQAKVYDRSAALGPCLVVLPEPLPRSTQIKLKIYRNSEEAFSGETSVSMMKRTFEDLAAYLFREASFEYGAMLMTGTGIVPSDQFTLAENDRVEITIDHIGTLVNTIKKRN